MPAARAAPSREPPSSTSAKASIRRAALASRHRPASRRSSPALSSRRVTSTTIGPLPTGPYRRTNRQGSRDAPRAQPVTNNGRWYKTDGVIGAPDRGGCSTQDGGTWSVCIGHEHRGGAAVKHFAGLDVSLEETAICVVDEAGTLVREARVPSEPEALVAFFQGSGLALERSGLEACSLSAWLHEGLAAAGLPAVCIETRRAKAAMGAMPNKTDLCGRPTMVK